MPDLPFIMALTKVAVEPMLVLHHQGGLRGRMYWIIIYNKRGGIGCFM